MMAKYKKHEVIYGMLIYWNALPTLTLAVYKQLGMMASQTMTL